MDVRKRVAQIKKLKEELDSVTASYNKMIRPLLQDYSKIPSIYESFRERFSLPKGKFSTERRLQFIFVILILFCPKRLFSKNRMSKGLRHALSKTLGTRLACTLSCDANSVMVWYETYKQWADEIDEFVEMTVRQYVHDDSDSLESWLEASLKNNEDVRKGALYKTGIITEAMIAEAQRKIECCNKNEDV